MRRKGYNPEQVLLESKWLEKNKSTTLLKELEARNNLMRIKNDLKNKLSKKFSFIMFFSTDPDDVLVKEIEAREAIQSKSADIIIWSDLAEKIKPQLQPSSTISE